MIMSHTRVLYASVTVMPTDGQKILSVVLLPSSKIMVHGAYMSVNGGGGGKRSNIAYFPRIAAMERACT